MAESIPKLGKVQYRIMQALWRAGKATARQITDDLSRDQPTTHSTVQTLLRQLEAKGVIAHEVEDRTFIFRPLYQPGQMTQTPLRDLLQRVYNGSIVNLMSHLLKHEEVSPDELRQLRELIDE